MTPGRRPGMTAASGVAGRSRNSGLDLAAAQSYLRGMSAVPPPAFALLPPRFMNRGTPPHVFTLICMAALPALTMNIILPSLPRMAQEYQVDYAVMQLAVSLLLVTNAVVQVVIGPIADRYGRRPVMVGAMLVFLIGTAGTLAAPTAEFFLAMRMLQAVSAAGMVLARAVVRDMYPAAQAASMIGYVTMGMSIAPMLAPTIGGVLDEAFGWRAPLWFLLAGGIATTALIWADMGETAARSPSSFLEQFRRYPALLGSRRFWGYSLVSMLASASFFAYLGGAPFVASEIHHMTPRQVGLGFAAPAVGYAVGNFIAGRHSMRFGMNRMILIGGLVMAAGLLTLAALETAGFAHPAVFFVAMISVGLGNGIALPNANAGLLSVRPDLAGSASGLGGAITLGGGAAFATLAAAVLEPGGTVMPLVLVMLVPALLMLVIWRDLDRRSWRGA